MPAYGQKLKRIAGGNKRDISWALIFLMKTSGLKT